MSSKSSDRPSRFAVLKNWSITRRLVVSYTGSAFLMLVITTGFFYWTERVSLAHVEKKFIADRLRVYHAIVESRRDFVAIIRDDIEWEGSNARYPQYYIRLTGEEGKTLVETPGMAAILPGTWFSFSPRVKDLPALRRIRQAKNGKYYLLVTQTADSLWTGRRVTIQMALDVTTEESIIIDNNERMAGLFLIGILISAAISVFLARRVLRPLKEIAGVAEKITVEQINVRTDPARWPEELKGLATSFNGMLNRLEESFNRLANFASNMAHELRTPINNLMGEVEVALSKARTQEEYRRVMESVHEEHLRLSRLIDALLFLARAESPETKIERTLFDPVEEIEKVSSFYEAMAEEKKAKISCSGSGLLNADRLLFRRAISNLVANALYYSPEGVEITVSVTQLNERTMAVIVRDTGYGIDGKDLSRIFDRFYRGENMRANYPQGSGLGLSIVKSIMDLHNGTVTITSKRGEGTKVALLFPSQAAA